MSASPLVFTYNYPLSSKLDNIFLDASGSPLPGTSTADLITLESANFIVQGATLTIQFYTNVAKPTTGQITSLYVNNVTIIASSGTNTIGTMSWSQQYLNPVPGTDPLVSKARVSKASSYVMSASGIFASYLFGNVIFVNDNERGGRTIYIYSAE